MNIATLLSNGYNVNTEGNIYKSIETSITTGTSNSEVTISPVTKVHTVLLDNDNSVAGQDMVIKFNDTSNTGRTVKAGESLSISIIADKIYLSNSSGSTVNYRLFVVGV